MKVISAVIEGMPPGILLHNPAGQIRVGRQGRSGAASSIPSPEEEAKLGCYWTEDKSSLMMPSINIQRCITVASSGYKAGKKTLMPYVAGSMTIDPAEVAFGIKDYEIDLRPVVIMGSRVMRARPKLPKWKLGFDIVVEEQDWPIAGNELSDILKAILEEGGRRLGLGDFRPQKKSLRAIQGYQVVGEWVWGEER